MEFCGYIKFVVVGFFLPLKGVYNKNSFINELHKQRPTFFRKRHLKVLAKLFETVNQGPLVRFTKENK